MKPMINLPAPEPYAPTARPGPEWRHFFDILFVLVSRDFKGRYRNTALGMLWAVIGPLLYLSTFYFVFKLMLDLGITRYASFVFIGLIVWMWFQTSLSQGAAVITAHPNLVSQPGFPVAALPAMSVMSAFITFAISLPMLFIVIAIEGGRFHVALLALPLIVLIQFVLTLGVTFLVAAINVRFRDTQYVLPVILQLGYFAIPIFYDLQHVPARYRALFDYNPLALLVGAYRRILIDGRFPEWGSVALTFGAAIVILAVGFRYFQRARDGFLEDI